MKMTSLAAATLAALGLAAPAQAAPTTPPLSPAARYFNCTTTTKVGTIVDSKDAVSWSATAPEASYQSGAGCGWLDPFAKGTNQPNVLYDAVYGGVYKGEIKQIELNLYSLITNPTVTSKTIDVKVFSNGVEVFSATKLAGPLEPAGQAAKKATFTLSGIDLGEVLSNRQITIAVAEYYADDIGAWIHGAKEFPAGVRIFDSDDLPAEVGA